MRRRAMPRMTLAAAASGATLPRRCWRVEPGGLFGQRLSRPGNTGGSVV